MNNKIIKTIDEHNIDRDANVVFSFDLDGSDYVVYRISRDEEQDNLFVSKVVRNIDNTYNMINVDDAGEKSKLNSIVMALVQSAVKNPADKLAGDSVSLSDGKTIKFINTLFNKEQKIEVRKTYVTTVKKEVSRVAEKYYDVVVLEVQEPVMDDIFPSITPITTPVQEEIKVVEPTVVAPTPVVVQPEVVAPVAPTGVPVAPVVAEPMVAPEIPAVAPTNVAPVEPVIPTPVVPTPVAQTQPQVVVPEPVPASVVNDAPQTLVFNASKETNLNAALGEVANTASIPVENIEPVRDFGVETPVQLVSQPVVEQQVAPVGDNAVSGTSNKKAGFANSKFFMVVAIAFFLASCIFLGFEVYNYFQITK